MVALAKTRAGLARCLVACVCALGSASAAERTSSNEGIPREESGKMNPVATRAGESHAYGFGMEGGTSPTVAKSFVPTSILIGDAVTGNETSVH